MIGLSNNSLIIVSVVKTDKHYLCRSNTDTGGISIIGGVPVCASLLTIADSYDEAAQAAKQFLGGQ